MLYETRIKSILEKLKNLIDKASTDVIGFKYAECDYCNIGELPDSKSLSDYFGQEWGKERETHVWFCNEVTIPDNFDEKKCELEFYTQNKDWFFGNPQFLVYIDGEIVAALDYKHTSFPLNGKRKFSLVLYGFIGEYIAGGCNEESIIDGAVTFSASVIEKDFITQKFYYDAFTPFSALQCLGENTKEYQEILNILSKALNLIKLEKPYSKEYYSSLKESAEYIKQLYGKERSANGLVSLVGQTHIDVAWLWTKEQSAEKALRSFTTALYLMDKYPEFKFMMCQPALYERVKKSAPSVYEQIKQRVRQKRWEPEGGVYVECDCNITGGESLIRQIAYAKKFFKQEFEVDTKVAWMPDTFGFSASLPQILKKCGLDKFITSKISWNDTNTFPYDTFSWKGIDGSEIFAYFLTAQDKTRNEEPKRFTIYNACLTVPQVLGTYERYNLRDLNDNVILTYGFGDGGGGPTAEYLEIMERLNKGIVGIPSTESVFLGEYADRIYRKLKDDVRLPVWDGEIYFEKHRGVYSSIAKIKNNNRRSEFELNNTEKISVICRLLFGTEIPREDIEDCWKKVLVNQFHDVLPGTSTKAVYDEADLEYSYVFDKLNAIQNDYFSKLCENVSKEKYLVVNFCDTLQAGTVWFKGQYIKLPNISANGFSVIERFDCGCTATVGNMTEMAFIENNCLKLVFDKNFEIVEILDKRVGRNIVKADKSFNSIYAYEDTPDKFDAWEISKEYVENSIKISEVVSAEKIDLGARVGYRVVKRFKNSLITQSVTLSDGDDIFFDVQLDWHERNYIIKAEFPLDLKCNKTISEIQFGLIERPVNTNTTFEKAKFEYCAQKFIDVSEKKYGVSVINDCKYGFDMLDGILKMTLLKCSEFPNKGVDLGKHSFRYSVFPHIGDLQSQTVLRAYSFNNPPIILAGLRKSDSLIDNYSVVKTDSAELTVSAVKIAENSNDVIVRIYENIGSFINAVMTFGFDVETLYLCDMLENIIRVIPCENNSAKISVKSFEVLTFRAVIKK